MGFEQHPFDFLSGQSADQEYPKNTYPKHAVKDLKEYRFEEPNFFFFNFFGLCVWTVSEFKY